MTARKFEKSVLLCGDASKEFLECGPSCPVGCGRLHPRCAVESACVSGCFCRPPLVLSNPSNGFSPCLPAKDCPPPTGAGVWDSLIPNSPTTAKPRNPPRFRRPQPTAPPPLLAGSFPHSSSSASSSSQEEEEEYYYTDYLEAENDQLFANVKASLPLPKELELREVEFQPQIPLNVPTFRVQLPTTTTSTSTTTSTTTTLPPSTLPPSTQPPSTSVQASSTSIQACQIFPLSFKGGGVRKKNFFFAQIWYVGGGYLETPTHQFSGPGSDPPHCRPIFRKM